MSDLPEPSRIRHLIEMCEQRADTKLLDALGQALRDYTLIEFGVLSRDIQDRLQALYEGIAGKSFACSGMVRGYITLGMQARRDCRREDAVRFGHRAVLWATLADNRALEAIALKMRGIFQSESGQIVDALDDMLKALTLEDTPDYRGSRFDPLSANVSMAAILSYAGQYKSALAVLKRAQELVDSGVVHAGPVGRVCLATNAATVYLALGDYRRGLVAISQAIPLLDAAEELGGLEGRFSTYFCYARLLMETGQIAEAARLLADVRRANHPRRWVDASWLELAEGLVAIHEGRIDAGLRAIDRATEEMSRLRPHASVVDLSMILARAYQLAGRPDEARARLKRAAEYSLELRRQETRRILEDDGAISFVSERNANSVERDVCDVRRRKLQAMAALAEYAEYPCARHIYRVGRLSEILATEIGMSASESRSIGFAGTLHDIGKIGVPREILAKAGALDPIEIESLRAHSTSGEALLRTLDAAEYDAAIEVARSHHERWDGTGYPDGLAGTTIPLSARIVALAEAYDAMTHERPWCRPLTVPEAIRELRRQSCSQFDPGLVQSFVTCIERLHREQTDVEAFLSAQARDTELVGLQTRIEAAIARLAGSKATPEIDMGARCGAPRGIGRSTGDGIGAAA